MTISSSHPDIEDQDIAIGSLRNGNVRAIIAVPAEAEPGTFTLTAGVYGWEKASGGDRPRIFA